ncbi:MAG: c-type cytochrome biogenesis protein CcmI [Thiohalomonadales bacterium]
MNATFWVISLLMVFVSLGLILPSILRKPKFGAEDLRIQNVLIAKEKLKELEVELKTERISPELYTKRKEELETALLNDTELQDDEIKEVEHSGNAAWVIAFITPVLAVALYLMLGTSPDLLNNQNLTQSNQGAGQGAGQAAGQQAQMSPEVMAEKIAARLEQEPDNAEGWAMLGQTFMQLKRYSDAVTAFEKSYALVANNPQVMFRYADALAMANNGKLEGKPIELINAALKITPRDMTGLWLSGMYAEENGDNKKAVKQWALLYEVVSGSQYQQPVMTMLTRVNSKLNKKDQIDLAALSSKVAATTTPSGSAAAAAIEVTVTIDDSIKSKVSPTDAVFIYAKAMSGPPMPLAAARKQVKDLPITITLNDAMAMMPAMKISKFQTVKIGARISKSGNAITQPGDIKQEVENVATANSNAVNIVLGGAAGSSKISSKAANSKKSTSTASNNTATTGSNTIKLKVTLDPALRNQVADTDVLFIYAKAMTGPKMPLAVVKRQVKDLPIYIALDDSMAMMDTLKLSAFDKVKVGARISKSGEVFATDGDLFTEVLNIATDGKQALTLTIDQVKGSKAKNMKSAAESTTASPSQAALPSDTGIKVLVTLDEALKAKANPEDSIFIYAKAMQGPPMPLAVVRKKVKDLPITVTLNDTMAMMPTMKLSKFNKVRIGARISKSGNAIAQSGDLYNEIPNISNSRSELLSIQINQQKP